MTIFEDIEELFQNIRDYNEYTRAIITLLTGFGALLAIYYFLRILYLTIRGKFDRNIFYL